MTPKHFLTAALITTGLACSLGTALYSSRGWAQSSPPPHAATIDAATRNEVAIAIKANLDRAYVFPDQAKAMDAALDASLARGDFGAITDGEAFAKALTELLRRTSHDGHLMVRYFPQAVPPERKDQADEARQAAAELAQDRRFNFGLSSVQRLKGNIGYIDLHEFGRPQGATPRIAATMNLLAGTDALIIDLRHCGGGDPDTVMAFASYLYDKPTHLNDIYWRDENRTERRWTQAKVAGSRYGQSRKVYLLTGPDTFSGCEDFAYALKNNHRATLIGQATGGGAHAGSPHRLTAHFMMFVPSGRPINPVTHTDWEGTGVAPDVQVPADKALDTAQVAALRALVAAEREPRWKAKLEQRIAEIH